MSTPERRDDLPAIGLDLLVVALFALLGRANHGETLAVRDVVDTALPFWAAALITHVGFRLAGRSSRPLGAGLVLWGGTWLGGTLLRLMLGETAAWPSSPAGSWPPA